MVDQTVTTETTPTESAVQETLLSKADQPVVSENESVLDTAGAEEKAAREAENKRILEADETTLTPEEKTTKEGLVKAKQEAADKAVAEIKAKGVPEKYDIKPPEGFTFDEKLAAEVTPIFKEAGLTNAQAQKMVDYHAKWQTQQATRSEEITKKWNEDNIKETLTALGSNAKSELAYVGKVKAMLSPETIEAFNASGIGNMKNFIYDMAKIGRLFSEEHLVNDKKSAAPAKSDAEILYHSMKQ